MTDKIILNPNYVISNKVLEQKSFFTVNDIVKKVQDELLEFFENNFEKLTNFVKRKLESFCEVMLISFNGFEYYVNK